MTNQETVFIGANNGGIEVFIGVGNKVGFAKTPKMLAYILDTHNIQGEVIYCSTMDFADEVGFATHDGAKILVDQAVAMRTK